MQIFIGRLRGRLKILVSFLVPALLISLLFLNSCSTETVKPRNVIFLLADDLGWRDLGCYGSDLYDTPNLDRLAEQGMKFTSAYTASPLCSPTRASILTGMEPGRLRFTTPAGHVEKVELDPQETSTSAAFHKTATPETCTRLSNDYLTFAEVLKEQGYSTAFMGKWHLGREPYIPENQGFDVVVGGREHPGPPPPGRFFAPWDIETLPVVPEGTHICDIVTDKAIEYVKQNKDNPFLLCLWYYDVHAPYQGKEELIEKYRNKIGPDNLQRCPTMGAMIENMDMNFGRLQAALEEMGLDENTMIIFTSDNGGNMYDGPDNTIPTYNYPLRAGKGINYEGGVRVPLIVKVPGLTEAGSVSDNVVSTVDHYTSLLELLDIPFPENLKTDGYSYVPSLEGESYVREPIYSTFNHNVVATGNRANISMRHGPWRLYKFYFDGPDREHRYELYNLDEDISETRNLAREYPEKVLEMVTQLDAHVEEAGILLPRKNENFDANVMDAWIGSEKLKMSVGDKVLTLMAGTENPWIETVYTPNVMNAVFHLVFEMKSTADGPGRVFWKIGGENTYQENSSEVFSPQHDGLWHEYTVPMSLEGMLDRIKISPCSVAGKVQLRNIRMETVDGYYIRDWPLY